MIYFVQFGHNGPIKIGTTENMSVRMDLFRSQIQMHISILSVRPGGRQEESEMHRTFARLRLGRTEQFRPGPELTEFLSMRPVDEWNKVEAVTFPKPKRRTTTISVKLDAESRERLRAIKKRYHFRKDTSAIRWAIDTAFHHPRKKSEPTP